MGALLIRVLVFDVHNRAPDPWKLRVSLIVAFYWVYKDSILGDHRVHFRLAETSNGSLLSGTPLPVWI